MPLLHNTMTPKPGRISQINRLLIRRKTDSIRLNKPIRQRPNRPSLWHKPINLYRQTWLRAISMLKPIHGIRKPDRAITMHHHIIHRVKRPSVEIPNHKLHIMRMSSRHLIQPAGKLRGPLCAEQDAAVVLVVYPAVAHGDLSGGEFLAGGAHDAIVVPA